MSWFKVINCEFDSSVSLSCNKEIILIWCVEVSDSVHTLLIYIGTANECRFPVFLWLVEQPVCHKMTYVSGSAHHGIQFIWNSFWTLILSVLFLFLERVFSRMTSVVFMAYRQHCGYRDFRPQTKMWLQVKFSFSEENCRLRRNSKLHCDSLTNRQFFKKCPSHICKKKTTHFLMKYLWWSNDYKHLV